MQLVSAHSYHTACTRVFEVTHGSCGVKKGDGLNGEHVTHPNQYAARSRELWKGKMGEKENSKGKGDVEMSV